MQRGGYCKFTTSPHFYLPIPYFTPLAHIGKGELSTGEILLD